MFPTVEVRWFCPGAVPPAVVAWFQGAQGPPPLVAGRVDHYLCLPGIDGLGIKVREGRIEVKQRVAAYGVVPFQQRVAGRVERWRKWSFELAGATGQPAAEQVAGGWWLAVEKVRRLRRYQVSREGEVQAVSPTSFPSRGCDWELGEVCLGGQRWWTVAFEAFGEPEGLRERLARVAESVLAAEVPAALRVEDSCGYPAWLASQGSQAPEQGRRDTGRDGR